MKKFISMLLCAVMLIGILPIGIFAAAPADWYDLASYGQKTFNVGYATPTSDGKVSDGEYALALGPYLKSEDSGNDDFFVAGASKASDAESFSVYSSYDDDYIYFATVVKNTDGVIPTNGRTDLYFGDTENINTRKTIKFEYASGEVTCTDAVGCVDPSKTRAVVNEEDCTLTIEFALYRTGNTAIASRDKYFVRFYFGFYSGVTMGPTANLAFPNSSQITIGSVTVASTTDRLPHVFVLDDTNAPSTDTEPDTEDETAQVDQYALDAYGQKHFYTGLATAAAPSCDGKVSDKEYTSCFGTFEMVNDGADSSFIAIDGAGDTESFAIYTSYDDEYIYFATVQKNATLVPTSGRIYCYIGDTKNNNYEQKAIIIKYTEGRQIEYGGGSNYLDTSKTAALIDSEDLTVTFEFAIRRSALTELDKYFIRFAFGSNGDVDEGSINLGFYSREIFEVSSTEKYLVVDGKNVRIRDARRIPHVLHLAVNTFDLDYYGQKTFEAPNANEGVTVDGTIGEREYHLLHKAVVAEMSSWTSDGTIIVVDSTGNAESAEFYASWDSSYIYFAAVLNNTAGKTHANGQLIVYFGDNSDMSVYDRATIIYNGKTASIDASNDVFVDYAVTAQNETITYEIAIDRSKVTSLDEYFVRAALYMYGDDDTVSADDGSCNFGYASEELYSAGFLAGGGKRFPHVISLGDGETVHSYDVPLSCGEAQHKYVCVRCGETLLEAHEWDGGTVALDPTETSAGVRIYTCTHCGVTKQELIPKKETGESGGNTDIEAEEDVVIDVNGSYNVVADETIVSVEITWNNAEFTYIVDDNGSGWKEDESLDITVVNRSNATIKAAFEWRAIVDGIMGEFSGLDENDAVEIASAVGAVPDNPPTAAVSFCIVGGEISDTVTLGYVTITVSIVESEINPGDTPSVDGKDAVYEHVLILGVDGIGNFRRNADTPNIDAIFANGAITDVAKTSYPSVTAPCWSSMFTGVKPSVMGVSSNPGEGATEINATYAAAQNEYPTIFSQTYDKYGAASSVSIVSWYEMNDYVIKDSDGTVKINADEYSDLVVKNTALNYINGVDGKEMPRLMFLHFDSADAAGHTSGYDTDHYYDKITRIDGYIGEIYAALDAQGMLENTLIILATDHGGVGTTHGGSSDAEMTITLGFAGRTVLPIKQFDMTIRDIAPVITHALGLEASDKWDASDVSIPEYLFSDITLVNK